MAIPKERHPIFNHPVKEFFCKYYSFPTYQRIMYDEGNRITSEITGKQEEILQSNFFNIASNTVAGSIWGAAINLLPAFIGWNIMHRFDASELVEKMCAGAILAAPVLTNIGSGIYEGFRHFRSP